MVVVWLHILGPYWCTSMCVALFGSRQCNTHTPTRP